MAKLIMMKGLPASGKSTYAKELVEQGDWVRVNRDLLREMLHFSKWSGTNEKHIIQVEKQIVVDALSKGINVVVDDTNLSEKHYDMWSNIAKSSDVLFEVVQIEQPFEILLDREKNRKKIGQSVIYKLALQYGKHPQPAKPFVLCDIDGTIANCEHRVHWVRGEKKDWKSFFNEMDRDTPIADTLNLLTEYKAKGHDVILLTARPEDYREVTEKWVSLMTDINPLTIIMRNSGDSRPDTEVKEQMYNLYFKDKYQIETMIDDRPIVIRMWKDIGVPVIDVGNGDEF